MRPLIRALMNMLATIERLIPQAAGTSLHTYDRYREHKHDSWVEFTLPRKNMNLILLHSPYVFDELMFDDL